MNKKLRNDLTYLWSDYRWFLTAGLIAVFLVAHFALAALMQKETAVYAMLIDCHTNTPRSTFESECLRLLGLDSGTYSAQIETGLMFSDTDSGNYTMASLSRFLADIGSGKLDLCAMSEEDFTGYDRSGTWADLRTAAGGRELTDRMSEDALLIRGGRVIGIYADRLPGLVSYGCYEDTENRGVVGLLYNAPHAENAVKYLQQLGEEAEK